MEATSDKRVHYRRYEDRRVALMLALHETIFDDPPGDERDLEILEKIRENFGADRAAIAELGERDATLAAVATEDGSAAGSTFTGAGIGALNTLLVDAPGALTLTRVKRPAVFDTATWESLWSDALADLGTALLCVRLAGESAPARALWILQSHYSREWSSRDRDLAEEVASLLGRARDRNL